MYIVHIGVGSNVVCSTGLGNARASVGGTDSRMIHAFFMSLSSDIKDRYERVV